MLCIGSWQVSAAGGSAAVPSQEPKPQAAIPGEGKTALPSETQPPSVDPPSAAETAPAVPQGPQSLPSLHSATVTDPESGAQVTTRSDLMMVIDYVTGDRVIQDSDRTRVTSYASGGFMVESAGLPTIAGTAAGVVLEPLPGNSQHSSTRRFRLAHTLRCIVLSWENLICLRSSVHQNELVVVTRSACDERSMKTHLACLTEQHVTAGLTMQWASTDRSIQVNLNQVAQLACLGNVAAFLNSELAMGQATGSALSVSQLCKAVATANMTKAAEIAKQMAQSQKVQNLTCLTQGILLLEGLQTLLHTLKCLYSHSQLCSMCLTHSCASRVYSYNSYTLCTADDSLKMGFPA